MDDDAADAAGEDATPSLPPGGLSAMPPEQRAAVQAQLMQATSGLAEQLQSITAEMNRLKSELYSDSGLGNIQKEASPAHPRASAPPAPTRAAPRFPPEEKMRCSCFASAD